MTARCRIRAAKLALQRSVTLAELIVALSASTLLIGGIASSVLIATKALPDAHAARLQSLTGRSALSEVVEDFSAATGIIARTDRSAELLLLPRGNTPGFDIVRYSWSGTRGDPLMRQLNGAAPYAVTDPLHTFSINWQLSAVAEPSGRPFASSNKFVLASFVGWPGQTPVYSELQLGANQRAAIYFRMDLPNGLIIPLLSSVSPLSMSVLLRKAPTDQPGMLTVALHTAGGATGIQPVGNALAVSKPYSTAALPEGFCWITLPLPPYPLNPGGGYVVVLHGDSPLTNARLQIAAAAGASANGIAVSASSDSGATWSPGPGAEHFADAPCYIHGAIAGAVVAAARYYTDAATITVRPDVSGAQALSRTVRLVNRPETP